MSLLNKNRAFSVRDYFFISVGLLGLFWFFLTYGSNDPRSVINTSLDKQAVSSQAVQALTSLGFEVENYSTQTRFESNAKLLDSLQVHLGRREMIEMLSDSVYPEIQPYYWETFFKKSALGRRSNSEMEGGAETALTVRLNQQGRLVEVENPNEVLPDRPLNRQALIHAFDTDSSLSIWTSLPDSAWKKVLRFDLDADYNSEETSDQEIEKNTPHAFSRSEIIRLAGFYLKKSGWTASSLDVRNIQIKTIRSSTAAKITFQNSEHILGQSVQVEATVLPTGSLLQLSSEYNRSELGASIGDRDILQLVRMALVMLFGFVVLIIFYFRIRSRAVDTSPALVVGVLAGLIIPAIIFLEEIQRLSLFDGATETGNIVALALQMGFGGAFVSISFFVIFSVGDSLMRQHWPEKHSVYDYLRQGMFFNKPIGEMLIRSIVLAFTLCGIWSTMLFFFPDLYFEIERSLLQYESAWPPIFMFLNSAWFSFIMMLGIFAVLGTQVYGSFKSNWITALSMVVGFAVMAPVLQGLGPAMHEILLFAIMGIVFTVIYFKWDFITLALTHFLFVCMLEVSSGWVIKQSPDLYVFIMFFGFLVLVSVVGILAITKGKERQSLPTFVPEYVEELAQEQRIKQELEIAREVQQSFLPIRTPTFDDLEIAAICKPAFETGGDYYDFVQLDDHRVAVTIGDVSGKGIQAAFYMTFVKGIIHSLCRETDSPAEVLKKTNRLFCENAPRGTFISLVYGIMDLEKKTFNFARAGHNPILRITSENGNIEQLQPKGIGIGLTKGGTFEKNIEEVELSLSDDDLLVLYTDGIVEALNNQKTFYGTKRLNNILKRNKWRSAEEILKLLSGDVHTFIGNAKQHDDMTMIVMKFKDTIEE